MPTVELVQTTPEHIKLLARRLRKQDREEVEKTGLRRYHALWNNYRSAFMVTTAFVDGEIAAIWGIGGTPMGVTGMPWLLTSDAVHNVSPLTFARVYKKEVQKMRNLFPRLANYVDASYTSAVRLLDLVGFKLSDPLPMGKNGELFIRFEME